MCGRRSVKNGSRAPIVLVPAAFCVAIFAGCGHVDLDEKVADLQREVIRLQAEKAQLQTSNASLDDELVRLKSAKKSSRLNPRNQRPGLKVVRFSPDTVDDEPHQQPSFYDEEPLLVRENEKRVVLSLNQTGNLVRRSPSTPRAVPPSKIYAGPRGDNLGVVRVTGRGPKPSEVPAVSGDPMEQFQAAYRSYSNRQYQEAIAQFGAFVAAHPRHDYADDAFLWTGEAFFAKGAIFKAIGAYEHLVKRYPRSDKISTALYRIGFAYDQLHDSAKAKEYYFMVVERYPGSASARKASQRVAVLEGDGPSKQPLINTAATR